MFERDVGRRRRRRRRIRGRIDGAERGDIALWAAGGRGWGRDWQTVRKSMLIVVESWSVSGDR